MKQNNTNKTFKTELEKLKQMSIEDRLWYIWEYYKLQIFAFFLVIFLLYEAGTCIYRNLQDTMLYCVTVNETSLLSSDFSVVQKEFEEKMALTKLGRKTLFLTVLYLLMTATKKFMTSIITLHQTLS